jgi:4-hydroxy-tetrahydrodipicolinate reductase
MAIRLAISGCCGRMGRSIASLALEDKAFAVTVAGEAAGHEAVGKDLGTALGRPAPAGVKIAADLAAALGQADVLIEFTTPEATVAHAQAAQKQRIPMVIGTTGLAEPHLEQLRAASATIALVVSPNMSSGVNVLTELARAAAQRLGADFDIEVVESHHRHKKDSPSGTAKRLAEQIADARRQPAGSIPVHAVRAGDIVGDHTVILAGPSERLELTHRAHGREVFSRGALRAARFLIGRAPGLYDMRDVLGDSR